MDIVYNFISKKNNELDSIDSQRVEGGKRLNCII